LDYADGQGHSHGKEAYIEGLKKFDYYLGLVMDRTIRWSQRNFYADHGLQWKT